MTARHIGAHEITNNAMISIPHMKRVRIVNHQQSRNGCYTCKARRIKCDETKPSCLRCERSKRECEGYRDQISTDAVVVTTNLSRPSVGKRSTLHLSSALSDRVRNDYTDNRLALLACTALQHGEPGRNTLWTITLPQLCYANEAVASSLASLGAAIESANLPRNSSFSASTVAAQKYAQAIRQTQEQLVLEQQPTESLLISCMLLGCAEVVQWRELNALTHLQGSMELLRHRSKRSTVPDSSSNSKTESEFTPMDELDLLFVQLDICTSSYALGLPPRLPAVNMEYLQRTPSSHRRLSDLELEAIALLHKCYRVSFAASQYKYVRTKLIPADITFNQARCAAELVACVATLTKTIKEWESLKDSVKSLKAVPVQLVILRSQCLAGIVHLSMATNPYECGYDAYEDIFQQIIIDAQILRQSRSESNDRFGQFSISIGIQQALVLSADKYRHPLWRRRAIAILRQGGREGPWHGRLLAAEATRAMEIEEAGTLADGRMVLTAADIPESVRLHGMGMDVEAIKMLEPDASCANIKMSRCWDIDKILLGERHWEDESYWELWDEIVHF